jgi:hypothetical protein
MELTEGQMRVVERLVKAGFRPMAIPPYERALILRKGECVALLGPVENGGLRMLVPPTFLVDGNLSVKLKRGEGRGICLEGEGVGGDGGEVAGVGDVSGGVGGNFGARGEAVMFAQM